MNYDQIISQKIQNIKPSGIRKFFDILGGDDRRHLPGHR